jgi:hypothetical protein
MELIAMEAKAMVGPRFSMILRMMLRQFRDVLSMITELECK